MTMLRQRHYQGWIVVCCLFLLLAVAGCASNSPASATIAKSPAPAEAAPLSLGPDVDVKTVAEIRDRADVLVLDVREQWEYDEGHIPGITFIPMNTVPNRLAEIPTDKAVIVTCRSGNRSGQVVDFLRQQGFTIVHNMTGGIVAWQQAGLPVEK